VSVMPQRRFVNVPTESSSRDPGDDSPHDM